MSALLLPVISLLSKIAGLKTIPPKDLHAAIQSQRVTVIDVNARHRWELAHVPGAINLDPAQFSAKDLPIDSASDSAPGEAGPVDAGADAQAVAVNLTMSAACGVNWSTAVFQGPPLVATSMSAIVPATNERVTLIRRTSKSEVQLSSTEQRANGDTVEIYARGQLFRNSCNVATGPCVYVPGSMTFTSDPIAGTLKVNRYDVALGELDMELANVVLQSATTADYCTVSGRVRARR